MSGERYTVTDAGRAIEFYVHKDGDCEGYIAECVTMEDAQTIATALNRESAVSELLAALRPFARMAEEISENTVDAEGLGIVGELRRAAEAVQKWEQSNG